MQNVVVQYIDILSDIFTVNLNVCDIAVCLASIEPREILPIYMRLELSRRLTETFREVASSVMEEYKKGWSKHDLVLHDYTPESKLDDYEIELLDLSQYDTIKKQLEALSSLQDLGTFHEDKEFISNLRFYVIAARPLNAEPIYFYRVYTQKKMLSKSPFFAIWRGQEEYDSVVQPMFLFDKYIDCVSRGNSMFILKKENFHHIFHFLEEIHKLAKQTLKHIKIRVPIANFDQFADACERDTRKLRKLKNIATQSYLDNVSMDDIKRAIQMHNLRIPVATVGGAEMIVFEHTNPWEILKLLDDDYLKSVMTSKNYEVSGKRPR